MITYPGISPVLFSIGPLQVHWYGMMYLLGFLLAWGLARYRASHYQLGWTPTEIETLIFDAALGVIVGGRLGYMLFYTHGRWLADPLSIVRVWEGGMSFHGGLIGVMVALWWFGRRYHRSFLSVTDFTVPLVPLGIALGRFGNFINGELWGRVTDVPWAMIFPHTDGLPRHPSQLYELGLEGILLFVVVWWYAATPRVPGRISGVFLIGYALARLLVECVRAPDQQMGYVLFGWMTMGQLLSVPLLVAGLYLLCRRGVCKPI